MRAIHLFLLVLLFGWHPTPVEASPEPNTDLVTRLVEDSLDAHIPIVQVNLEFARPDEEAQAMERAGIFAPMGAVYNDCGEAGQRLLITEIGQRKAAAMGWSVWGGQVDISLGRLLAVGPVTAKVVPGGNLRAVFQFRVLWNANAIYLKTVDSTGDWRVITYAGTEAKLLEKDKTYDAVVTLVRNRDGRWAVSDLPRALRTC